MFSTKLKTLSKLISDVELIYQAIVDFIKFNIKIHNGVLISAKNVKLNFPQL